MKIPSVGKDTVLPVQAAQLPGMKIHPISVCPEGAHLRIHLVGKAAQRNIHEPHGKIQFIPADTQDLPADLLQLMRRLFCPLALFTVITHIFPFSQETVCAAHS